MALSSDDSETEEDFVVLGTPLPELDESEVTKKPITVQDLTAKDKEGRRRFHGAFTGGFSAGYFNTVGSKEGFTPTAFVSSRSQKHDDAQVNRPEDFMDDEDLEEHGIAPRKFATAGNYTSEERKRKLEDVAKRLTQSSALDFGGALNDLVIPEYLPIGIKLLRKMGWREGQGLGPRVKKKTRRKESKKKKGASAVKKVYGCALPPSDSDSDELDPFIPSNLSDLTFAPSDVTPISLNAKDDLKGLGYRGLDPSLALPGSHVNLFGNPVKGKKTGKGIKGHAFGVGALEDDDDDIFAQDSLSNYDLTMRENEDDDQDGNFGWTAPRSHAKQKLPVSYVGKLLEGFCLSSKPLQSRKKFPPPKLPADFKSRHWSRRRRKDEADDRQNKMTAVDRGLMLGEKPIMNSVFDLVGSKDKVRMDCAKEAIVMNKSLDATSGTATGVLTSGKEEKESSQHSSTEKKQQSKFLSRFTEARSETMESEKDMDRKSNTSLFKGSLSLQPFRKDAAKQARFDQYLSGVQQKLPDPYGQVSNSRMTEWEKARERDEFNRSAKLFRPMSAMMSSRFVQGAMLDDKNQDSKMDDGGEVSDEVKASEMRMFGKLTREEFEWHPDKVLCKRFNVPNPYPGSDIVGLPNIKRDKFSVFNFLSFGDYRPKESDIELDQPGKNESEKSNKAPLRPESSDKSEKKKPTLSSIFKVLDDPDFHRPPTDSKPNKPEKSTDNEDKLQKEDQGEEEEEAEADVDLFRAIFKNSDSEDSEEDGKSEKENMESMSDDDVDDRKKDDEVEMLSMIPSKSSDGVADQNIKGDSKVEQDKGHITSPEENLSTPLKSHVMEPNRDNQTPNLVQNASVKSVRSGTRWDSGGAKSIFSVLDEVNNDASAQKPTKTTEDSSDSEYGPALPPPGLTSGAFNTVGRDQSPGTETVKCKEKEKTHHRREKHKEKKDKKKKSKHKSKKEKKHKKSKKSSKSKKTKPESSGSEADSESRDEAEDDSDVSDKELLNRFMQVSRSKSGKS